MTTVLVTTSTSTTPAAGVSFKSVALVARLLRRDIKARQFWDRKACVEVFSVRGRGTGPRHELRTATDHDAGDRDAVRVARRQKPSDGEGERMNESEGYGEDRHMKGPDEIIRNAGTRQIT